MTLTETEKATAHAFLLQSREALLASVRDLSEAQWRFQSAPDCWSIAGVVEHVAIIEGMILRILETLDQAVESQPDRDDAEADGFIVSEIPKRLTRMQAPPPAEPTGRWEPEQAVANFLESRAQVEQVLESDAPLRGRVRPHPSFGPWDGYPWILGACAHSARHTKQILEIKAHAEYPR